MHPVEALLVPLGRALRNRRSDEAASLIHALELATDNNFTLSSSGFNEGEVIHARYCGPLIGESISPSLTWGSLPKGTTSLLLIFEDIDVPIRVPGIHTIAQFPPVEGGLPDGALSSPTAEIQFLANRGRAKYVGPRPIPGHGPHRYRFHVYAPDTRIDFATLSGTDELLAATKGHVLASGTLTGTRES